MLPQDIVSADSGNAFKNKLDNLRTSKTVLNFFYLETVDFVKTRAIILLGEF